MDCGRETCFSCRSKPGSCPRQGVVYSIVCQKCKEAGVDTVYYGETAWTPYDRGEEHLKALREKNMERPLWEQHQGEHEGEEPAFEMGEVCYASSPHLSDSVRRLG